MINLNKYKEKSLISREAILSAYSSYNLFKFYIPNYKDKLINSPLRKEKTPSFGLFKTKSGEWFFKDFGGDTGDIFKFIALKYFDGNYFNAICKVAIDLGMDDDYFCPMTDYTPIKSTLIKDKEPENNKLFTLDVKITKFTSNAIKYWNNFFISIETLRKYNVFQISNYYINRRKIKADDLAFVYFENKDGRLSKKIYQPNNKIYKFINSHFYSVHDGYTQLPNFGNILLITKSRKDVMSISENTEYNAIGVQAETILIKDSVMDEYKSRFNQVITLFDNDEAGEILEKKYKEKYNTKSIFIPKATNQKDFSDYIKYYGKINAQKLLGNLINNTNV